MGLHFLIGPSMDDNAQETCRRALACAAAGSPVFLLVPEWASLTAEQRLVALHPRHVVSGVTAAGFSRLALRVFEELGLPERVFLDDNGKNLLLAQTINGHLDDLAFFSRKAVVRPGFIRECKSLFSEFLQCRITPDILNGLTKAPAAGPLFARKMGDLALLYQAFLDRLEEEYTTAELQMEALAARLEQSEVLKRTHVFVEGYHFFSPLQMAVLQGLMRTCPEVTVVLTLPGEALLGVPRETDLFAGTRRVYEQLSHLAEKEQIRWYEPERVPAGPKPEDLTYLAEHYGRPAAVFSGAVTHVETGVATDPRMEVKALVSHILHRVHDGARYHDMAVIMGDAETYAPLLEEAFADSGLPLFVDRQEAIRQTPGFRFVFAALSASVRDYSYETAFELFKSGFLPVTEEEIFRLENFCLACGIRGASSYAKPFAGRFERWDAEELAALDETRGRLWDVMAGFHEAMKGQKPGAVRVQAVRDLLSSVDMAGCMERLAAEREKEGDHTRALRLRQTMDKWEELLSQVETLLGGWQTDAASFAELLEAGCADLKVAVVPPVIDRIVAGDMIRTRLDRVKEVFLIGADDGHFPAPISSEGMLTERDRQVFFASDVELSESRRREALAQPYYVFLALTKPTERLTVTYSETSADGKPQRASMVFGELKALFGPLALHPVEPGKLLTAPSTLPAFADGLRQAAAEEEVPDGFKDLAAWYLGAEAYADIARGLIAAAFVRHEDEVLPPASARTVAEGVTSVSRLEKYGNCPYSWFLQYGLGLRERKAFERSKRDIGTIAHAAMEQLVRLLTQDDRQIASYSDEERLTLARTAVRQAAADMQRELYLEGPGTAFAAEEVAGMLSRALWVIGEQQKRGRYRPFAFEQRFLPGSRKDDVLLRGQIDRVDVAEAADSVAVNVHDYKTGQTTLDYGLIAEGLQMQLVLYLEEAMRMAAAAFPGKLIVPGGIYYDALHDGFVEPPKDEADLEKKRLAKGKLSGIAVTDENIISRLEPTPAKGSSEIVKNLRYEDHKALMDRQPVTAERMQELIRYVRGKAEETVASIEAGQIPVRPVDHAGSRPCRYCPYLSVCGFDRRIDGFAGRTVGKLDAEAFWKMIGGE